MLSNEEMTVSLRKLVKIGSVAGIDVSKEAPYGAEPARALKYALGLCDRLGMRTVNRDGIVGWAEIGEGDEMAGVLVHLDVVPAGEGWSYPAYDLTENGGRLYGRGVSDDKGPAVACIYAMKDILDSKVRLDRRIRIIFGQSEENGAWDDMAWYREHEELPVFGFTPDADFPAIYGEKGLLCMELSMPLEAGLIEDIKGGDASNMVAFKCRATVKGRDYETEGRGAHASIPEEGVNAISAMMELLSGIIPEDPFVRFYQEHIGWALNGEKMGCALSDEESGVLTMNAGTIGVKDGRIVMQLDVRNPVTFPDEAVFGPVRSAAAGYGIDMKVIQNQAPVYMDKNGRVIQSLLSVYRGITGDMSEPIVIGGGTYARAMDNIVAFGPMLPGRELTEHQSNEYILKEDFYMLREIYRAAILALARL